MSLNIVETACGRVQGEKVGNVWVWKGIPYAKPPMGSLRFQPPEPPEKWEGIRGATEFGPVAPQPNSEIMQFLGNRTDNMSEDCLTLNTWSPGADNKKRPVMVWIHGGAFIFGSGSSPIYDGASFAELGDVVVVTINYRLGILGFLHLAEIGGADYAASGNCGILDQIAALRWVKENIESFGGDPDQITIFGESAGAMSVGILLTMPAAKGLFNQAILQSGAARNAISTEKATKIAQKLLAVLEVDYKNLDKLKEIPIEKLIEASNLLPMMSLVPVIDGKWIPRAPEEALTAGVAKDITVLIGTNKDEYKLFSLFDPVLRNPDGDAVAKYLDTFLGSRWKKLSDEFDEPLTHALFDRIMTRVVFTAPALKLAEEQIKNGASVYMYRFDWETPVFNGGFGSCHALELPFVWNTYEKPGVTHLTGTGSERASIANRMHLAWIAFARSGNPNTDQLPHWPGYNLNERATMLFNIESRVEKDPDRSDRLKWEKAMAETPAN
ncbi:MAG: carboxylesterase/lipase family protein [Tuberibacillus sp.]